MYVSKVSPNLLDDTITVQNIVDTAGTVQGLNEVQDTQEKVIKDSPWR